MPEPVDALETEVAKTAAFLDELKPEEWELPTRCPPMSFRELTVHVLRGAYRITSFLAAPPGEDEPEMDVVTYYRYDPAEVGPDVVKRAQAESAGRAPDADIGAEWREAWAAAIAAAHAAVGDDPVVSSPFGTIRLGEYLKTRCVEVTIHSMDLLDALGREPDPSPGGLEVTCDVLRGLLGADLRPLRMEESRFALTGTGRAALTGEERAMLGPLADSFPVLQ
ncbi:MAG: maleylpyruvate isomerase family mycothiol-dependent enzyme [Actinobacteria bacterium]|nr:MAG: maleylpyruvate isomerase family mycothiol-dependent enzyme [Actinomycetota bacterium]